MFVSSPLCISHARAPQVFGTLLWDRLVTLLFAPQIIIVGHRDAYRALPTWRQLAHSLSVYSFWLVSIALWFLTDSIFVMIAAWYIWKRPFMLQYRGYPPT